MYGSFKKNSIRSKVFKFHVDSESKDRRQFWCTVKKPYSFLTIYGRSTIGDLLPRKILEFFSEHFIKISWILGKVGDPAARDYYVRISSNKSCQWNLKKWFQYVCELTSIICKYRIAELFWYFVLSMFMKISKKFLNNNNNDMTYYLHLQTGRLKSILCLACKKYTINESDCGDY